MRRPWLIALALTLVLAAAGYTLAHGPGIIPGVGGSAPGIMGPGMMMGNMMGQNSGPHAGAGAFGPMMRGGFAPHAGAGGGFGHGASECHQRAALTPLPKNR